MGIFRKKKSEPEKKKPWVIDPDAFLIDEGRMLASQERFMEAVMAFEKAEDVFREKLARGRFSDDSSRTMASLFLSAALGNHALVLARDLHRPDEALPMAQEAVALCKEQGAGDFLEEHELILQTVKELQASS